VSRFTGLLFTLWHFSMRLPSNTRKQKIRTADNYMKCYYYIIIYRAERMVRLLARLVLLQLSNKGDRCDET